MTSRKSSRLPVVVALHSSAASGRQWRAQLHTQTP